MILHLCIYDTSLNPILDQDFQGKLKPKQPRKGPKRLSLALVAGEALSQAFDAVSEGESEETPRFPFLDSFKGDTIR